jgi:hypothetical protein
MKRALVVGLAIFSASASAQDGVSIAVVPVAADTPSEQQAVVIGQLSRQGYARNPKYAPVDLEVLLDNGETPAAERQRRKAIAALDRCRAAYDAFELAPAVEACAEAIVGFEQSVAALTDIEPMLAALRFQGASYVLLGDTKNARRAFEQLHVLAPGNALSGNFPDTVKEVFEGAEARVATRRTGRLTVYATPAAAEVWIDGRFRGAAPLTVEGLPVGRHLVRVVRDGYQSYGTPADVTRKIDETVQATLRPTAQLAKLDALLGRLRTGGDRAPAELAQLLKVDQLLWLKVETRGDDVEVRGTLTDGVSGAPVAEAQKTFVSTGTRYRSDVELWIAESFRKTDEREVGDTLPGDNLVGTGDNPFVPDRPIERPTDPKVVVGWSFVGIGGAGFLTGVISGVYSLYTWDIYKNQGQMFGSQGIPNQTHPELDNVRDAFFVSSLVADIGWTVFVVGTGVGAWMVVSGLNDEEALEDVLSVGPMPVAPVLAGGYE